MPKPSFSLITIFWLMLAACGFLGGRASLTKSLQKFEGRAVNSELVLEARANSFADQAERSADTFNSFGQFIQVMSALGHVEVMAGRALEVIDGTTFVFEQYNESGVTISKHTVQLDAIKCPEGPDPIAERATQQLNQMLIEDHDSPWVVVIVTHADATSDPIKAIVVTQSARRGYAYIFAQFELIRAGLATPDETHPLVARFDSFANAEREAKANGSGMWMLRKSGEIGSN